MAFEYDWRLQKVACLLVAVAATGCGSREKEGAAPERAVASAAEVANAGRMLKAGKAAVCNAPAIVADVKRQMEDGWWPQGWEPEERQRFFGSTIVDLVDVTATAIDAAVPVVTCEATYAAREGGEGWENRLTYTLTLQLDTDEVRADVYKEPGLAVLNAVSRRFQQDVVDARFARRRDAELQPVCDRFRSGRGRWTVQQLDAFVSQMNAISVAYDYELGAAGAECERLIRDEWQAARSTELRTRARAQDVEVEQQRAAAAETAERSPREDRFEYVAPPAIVPIPPIRAPRDAPNRVSPSGDPE